MEAPAVQAAPLNHVGRRRRNCDEKSLWIQTAEGASAGFKRNDGESLWGALAV
jgi:hypothetical protein